MKSDHNHASEAHDQLEDQHQEHSHPDHERCFPPIGACFPTVPGAKHKLSRDYKLAQLAEGIAVPSSLAAATMHMARRFLRGKKAANPLEKAVYSALRTLPRDLLDCTVGAFEAIPLDQRNRIFNESLLPDPKQALDVPTLVTAFGEEIKQRVGIQVFGDPQAVDGERPGLARLFPPDGEIPPNQVHICKVNDLRTANFTPFLNPDDYEPREFQQKCEIKIGETEPSCEVLTADCPGNSILLDVSTGKIQCMRVLDIASGDSVVLEGVNYFNVDAKVRFSDRQTGNPVRDVDAFVFGDVDTPLLDENGVLINDCRVHDKITFTVPQDIPSALYGIQVIVPNNTGDPIFGTELVSDQEFINVIPPATARFEIVIDGIKCKTETPPEWFGSDELGMHTMAAAFDLGFNFINLPDVNPPVEDPSQVQDQKFRENDLDSGDSRPDIKKLVFKHDQPILAMLLCVMGDEIDSDDAYEKEITSSSEVFLDLLKTELGFIFSSNGFSGISGILAAIVKFASLKVAIIAAAIAAAITIVVDIIIALWAPADPLIRDTISLTINDLDGLTSVSVPAPDPFSFSAESSAGPIRVNVNFTPPEKLATQYREIREYIVGPEDSRYEVTYRYNRVA